jgi:hypothetical protein
MATSEGRWLNLKNPVLPRLLAAGILAALTSSIPWLTTASEKTLDESESLLCPRPPRTDFLASWIWVPESSHYDWRNSYAYFRKKFRGAGKFTIDIAADNQYQVYLDGKFLDRGTASSDTAYQIFDTRTVMLEPADHVIAVLVHHIGQVCATVMRSRPGLFVEITGPRGEKIPTDSTWKVLPALAYKQHLPVMMSHFGFYEVCDCRQIPRGWMGLSFSDRDWSGAEIVGPAGCAPWVRMIPRDIPPLETRVVEAEKLVCSGTFRTGVIDEKEPDITVAVEMASRERQKAAQGAGASGAAPAFPVALARGRDEFAVLDFGREVSGHLKLTVQGAKAGQRIDLGYDEILDGRGMVNPRRTYVHFADRFFLQEDQAELEVFGPRGFRYLLIDAAAGLGGLAVTGARAEERTYPVSRCGTFRCSDERLDRLFSAGLLTTRLCMLDAYVDCPSRERVMWTEMAVGTECGSYGFGVTDLWRRGLFLLAQNTSRSGIVAGAVKGFAPCDYDPLLVSYTMYYVLLVCDYYLHSGDRQACESLFPTLMKQLEIISRFHTADGLVNEKWPGWGTFLDWSAMDFGGVSSCNNAIYLLMYRRLAELARALGKSDTAHDLEDEAARIEKAYRRNFWMEKEGLFVDAHYDGRPSLVRSQLANVLAIRAGVVKEEEARRLMRRVVDPEVLLPRTSGDFRLRPGFKPQTGGIVQIGTPGLGFYLAQALFDLGMDREALDYLRENWTPIALNGTFGEHFVADLNTSYCHGWSAGPVVLVLKNILGVRPVAPGWKEVRIAPQPGGLQWAEGTIPTPQGEIRASWKRVNEKMELTYRVPEGAKVVR